MVPTPYPYPIDYSDDEDEPKKKRSAKKWKDPNKPKRAMSAFFLFSQAARPSVKEEFPDASFGEVARILARKYKEMGPSDMNKWEKKAAEDKARYQDEMKHYIPTEDPTGGGTKKRKKDPNAPKRNMSAYFLYSIDIRPTVKEENPDAAFGEIARIISAKFKQLSEKERKIWDEKAVADKERYTREMADYTKA